MSCNMLKGKVKASKQQSEKNYLLTYELHEEMTEWFNASDCKPDGDACPLSVGSNPILPIKLKFAAEDALSTATNS